MDYWSECIATAFDDEDIKATKEQIEAVADTVEGAIDTYSLYNGEDHRSMGAGESTEGRRIKELEEELSKERYKRTCKECKGEGTITEGCGPSHYSVSTCSNCKGEGRL